MKTICLIAMLLTALAAHSEMTAAADNPKHTFVIRVTNAVQDIGNQRKIPLNQIGYDSLPLVTLDDIRYLYYNPVTDIATSLELQPLVWDRLKPRLSHLYMKSFVVFLDEQPIYSGLIVPAFVALRQLPRNYIGPVLILPDENNIPETLDCLYIGYNAEGDIYWEKDDPRSDRKVLNLFRSLGKLKFAP